MDRSVIWGAVFFICILVGAYFNFSSFNGLRPKKTLPGSFKTAQWEMREKKADKTMYALCVGVFVLLGLWYLTK